MQETRIFSSDVAFTPAVKAVQSRKGSRSAYACMEEGGSWETAITDELKKFVEAQTSVFLGTANAQGQPYVQHRGGPAGFLHVMDEHTIGLVDFGGNRQFISTGNLIENPKVHLFLMDYARRHRVKIWGTARVVEGDAELVASLMPAGYRARAEQAIVLTVTAWDVNCPQHIPLLLPAAEVQHVLAEKDLKIATLEAEVAWLRATAAQARI